MRGSMNSSRIDAIDFEKGGGLIPAIAQDVNSGKVLMMAYMNREALDVTLTEGRACYWSRSRKELWRKGAYFRGHSDCKGSSG